MAQKKVLKSSARFEVKNFGCVIIEIKKKRNWCRVSAERNLIMYMCKIYKI